jgi:hypothetical protein
MKELTFDALRKEFGEYNNGGEEYAIAQYPYIDTVAGSSNEYVTQGESYYFALGYDREGNAYRLIWEITNPDTEDESEACDWDEFEAQPISADLAPWHPDNL